MAAPKFRGTGGISSSDQGSPPISDPVKIAEAKNSTIRVWFLGISLLLLIAAGFVGAWNGKDQYTMAIIALVSSTGSLLAGNKK